jgi:hypothetical protein
MASMALPEFNPVFSDNAPAPVSVPAAPVPITAPLPHAALSRLPQLHEESRLALRRASLLSRAVPAAGTLLAMGSVAALLGGGNLGPVFVWSVVVLGGICAVLVSHLRTVAVFKDMAGSAADMRAILLYLGVAWGAGAFLALSPEALRIAAFAVVPTLALALLLRDRPAILAFGGPATLLATTALWLRTGDVVAAALLLGAQAVITLFLLRKIGRTGAAPAGLALR